MKPLPLDILTCSLTLSDTRDPQPALEDDRLERYALDGGRKRRVLLLLS
jgi:hypothetical protein